MLIFVMVYDFVCPNCKHRNVGQRELSRGTISWNRS